MGAVPRITIVSHYLPLADILYAKAFACWFSRVKSVVKNLCQEKIESTNSIMKSKI